MINTKTQAVSKLRNEYRDIFGRYGLLPASESDPANHKFDSENQNLFSGQAIMFLFLNKLMTTEDINDYYRGLEMCKVAPGLYSRYPLFHSKPDRHGISHDEMTGISIACMAIGETKIPQDIVEYGKSHSWAYIDENPDSDPFTSLRNVKLYISRIRQFDDRGLYRVASGAKMGLGAKLTLLGACIITSLRPSGHTSGRIMWWHKFQAFKLVGYKSKIIDLARRIFDYNNKKVYGNKDYMEDVYKIYFKPGHPFHELVKGLYL